MEFAQRFAIEMEASKRCTAYGMKNQPHILHCEPVFGSIPPRTRQMLCPEIERALIGAGLKGQELIDTYGPHVGTMTVGVDGFSRMWRE